MPTPERIDYFIAADGSERVALRIMGIFEVTDGRITAWRDYFDTVAVKRVAPFAA